jgi:hypothetical protein
MVFLQRLVGVVAVVTLGCMPGPASFVESGSPASLWVWDAGRPGRDGGVPLDGSPPDAARVGDAGLADAGQADASSRRDAGTCVVEAPWQLERRPVVGTRLLEEGITRVGVTERLVVEVALGSPCEFLGRVELEVQPGGATDFLVLHASAWVREEPCEPAAHTVPWVVSVPGRAQGNFMVVVADGQGGGILLQYDRGSCDGEGCACWGNSPPGEGTEWAPCVTDCTCAPGLSCIGFYGFAGPLWACARPCATDPQCGDAEWCPPLVADGPSYVCEGPGHTCETDDTCPPGHVCGAVAGGFMTCWDRRPWPTMEPCACDQECPDTQHCSLATRDHPACETWCMTAEDCPAQDWGVFTCGHAGTCVPLE